MRSEIERIPPRGWIPAAITAANLSLGFVALLQGAVGRYEVGVYLLIVAIILDMLDGRLARWLRATSVFGKQLDSFCDVLSFGAAPAFLVHVAVLRPLGGVGLAVALAYLLAAVFRLARFNLLSDAHAKARRTVGVPTPIGAGYLLVVVLMREQLPPSWAAAVVLVCALMMVSRWRLPDLGGVNLVTLLMVVGIFNYLAVVTWPNWYTVAWWNLWNLVILAAARREDRRVALDGRTS